jgi:hypothetical protein
MIALLSFAAFAQDTPTASRVWDAQLSSLEREFVPLVEAMPEQKFDYAPTAGVRTFGLQAMHAATVLYEVTAAIREEKAPVDAGAAENGPALKSKAQIVKYCKDAFVYAHKAMQSLTNDNQMGLVKSAFGANKTTRLNMASVAIWHSFDHYGQMVVYARLNGIVPPASR